jgi:hypothetical protein
MSPSPGHPVSRGDAVALGVIATGAVSVAVGAVVAIVGGALSVFADEPQVRLPLQQADIPQLDGVAGIATARGAAADVVLTDLASGARWLLLLEGALPALATIGVCVVAYVLALALMRGRPFRRMIATALGIIAGLVLVGGIASQACGAFGRALVVEDLAARTPELMDILWPFLLDLDLAPIGWGFILALVAAAFAIGSRIQRDTEGLV